MDRRQQKTREAIFHADFPVPPFWFTIEIILAIFHHLSSSSIKKRTELDNRNLYSVRANSVL